MLHTVYFCGTLLTKKRIGKFSNYCILYLQGSGYLSGLLHFQRDPESPDAEKCFSQTLLAHRVSSEFKNAKEPRLSSEKKGTSGNTRWQPLQNERKTALSIRLFNFCNHIKKRKCLQRLVSWVFERGETFALPKTLKKAVIRGSAGKQWVIWIRWLRSGFVQYVPGKRRAEPAGPRSPEETVGDPPLDRSQGHQSSEARGSQLRRKIKALRKL